MKKFAIKLLLFAAIFLIYDKLFIMVARRSADTEVDKRLEYLVNGEINKDIIIAGSSTGSRDIIASQIEEETGRTVYNLCYPGSNVVFHHFVVNTLVQFNDAPECLFLMVDDDIELIPNANIIYRKDRLYPLIQYEHIWKELAKRENTGQLLSRFLWIQRLSKYNFDLREKAFTPLDTIMECGSMPISWKPENTKLEYNYDERPYSASDELPEKLTAFKEIIKICELNDIKLVLVFPPIFEAHSTAFEDRIRQLAGEGVEFYIYDRDNEIYRNEDYYNDQNHLMRKGAVVFTDEIINFINRGFEG